MKRPFATKPKVWISMLYGETDVKPTQRTSCGEASLNKKTWATTTCGVAGIFELTVYG